MKNFIHNIIFFSTPLVLCLILLELYISYSPNSFNTKSYYLKSNLKNIEYLFLGSSHTDGNINLKYISVPSANIAHGSQDCQIDSALFFKYVKHLKKLKKVIIELDYHTLETKNNSDFYRLLWYYKYYDINLGNFKPYHKLSLYLSNTKYFNKYLMRKLNLNTKKPVINKFGFRENTKGLFNDLNFNEDAIAKASMSRSKKRHSTVSNINFAFNKNKVLSIINFCVKNNIEIIILKNPQYITYRKSYIKEKFQRKENFLNSLILTGKIKTLDFEFDSIFKVNDFNNSDHLNTNGAKKLSLLVDAELKK